MQESIWTKTALLPSFPPLTSDTKTDVLIIGGGIAGLLCAFQLKQAGVECLLIEAGRIGRGVTAGTTAKITSQHGLCYEKLVRQYGRGAARDYWRIHEDALEAYRQLCRMIPCDFEPMDNYIYSLKDTSPLDLELEACFRAGIPAELMPIRA